MVPPEWGVLMGENAPYPNWKNWAGMGTTFRFVCSKWVPADRPLLGRVLPWGRIPRVKDGGNSSADGVEISHLAK